MVSRKPQVASCKPHNKENKLIFLVGPTAAGKTEIAVLLAKKLNAEIISCDSMQVYKGMDIITSKPDEAIKQKAPHYLIDIISPTKEYNVSRYRRDALRYIKHILSKKKVPLLVGGTGLYMSILIDGIFKEKTQCPQVRRHFYKEAQQYGSKFLYEQLQKVDSQAAAKIHPNDTRRIVRALEVFKATGKPISQLQKQRSGLAKDYDIRIFCLNMERDALYKRVDERVDKMFALGLKAEAGSLLKKKLSKTASLAIGIRELKGYFDGLYDLEEAKRLIKRNTRQYAKRQLTWFKKDKRIEWIDIGKDKPKEVADNIWKKLF